MRWAKRALPQGLALPIIVGLSLRLIVLALVAGARCTRDECSYQRLAESLVAGFGYLPQAGHLWAPGYTYFLAGHYAFARDFLLAARVSQCLLSVATIPILFAIADRAFGRRTAKLTAWAFALEPTLIAYTHYLWNESLYLFLFVTAAALLLSLRRRIAGDGERAPLFAVASGVVYGVACLVKPIPLYFLGFVVPWLALAAPRSRRGVVLALLVALSTLATIVPWTVRNYRVYDRLVLIDATVGKNLRIGNSDPPPFNADWGLVRRSDEVDPVCEVDNIPDRDACERRLATRSILAHPARFFRRIPTKLADFWNPTSFLVRHVREQHYGALPRWIDVAVTVLVVGSTILLATAGVVGLCLPLPAGRSADDARAFRTLTLALIAYTLALHSVMFGMSRFRLPLNPFLMPFAALAWTERARLGEIARSPRRLALASSVIIALVVLWSRRIGPLFTFGGAG